MATQLAAAKKEYPNSTDEGKKLLEKIFGKENFETEDWKKLTKFEHTYPIFKKLKVKDPDLLILQKRKPAELTSSDRLQISSFVLQQQTGFKPNYDNSNQEKWWPWFTKTASGWVFSYSADAWTGTLTNVGSRLCQMNDEVVTHFGKNFTDDWNNYLTIKY